MIKNLKIEYVSPRKVMLSWEQDGRDRDIYKIYRSNSDSYKFEKIGEGRASIFIDENEKVEVNRPMYRVFSVNSKMHLEARPGQNYDKYALGLAYIVQKKLTNYSFGQKCKVMLKTNTFVLCPECYSETLEKRIKSSCDTCDGSGKINGMQGPVETRINVSTSQQDMVDFGDKEKKNVYYSCWSGNIPRVKEGDFIWLSNKEIGIVNQPPRYIEKLNSDSDSKCLIKQEFVIKILDTEHQAYGLDWRINV